VQQIANAGRVILTQLLQGLTRSRVADFADLRRKLRPDAGHLRQRLARLEQRRDVVAGRAQLALGVPVSDHPIGVLVLELEQIGDLAENARDVLVLHAPSEPSPAGGGITRSLVEWQP
jgi:hypothetical protein